MRNTLVAIGIGVFAVHAALAQNSRDTPRSEDTFCITLFKPAACTGLYGGEWYSATGSNECFAVKNLVHKINSTYAWFMEVRADDVQNLSCQDEIQGGAHRDMEREEADESTKEAPK